MGTPALVLDVLDLDAESNSGGISLTNFNNVTIVGIANGVRGLFTGTSGNISLANVGSINIDENFTATDPDSDGDFDGAFAQGTNRYRIRLAAGGTFLVCPICFKAKELDETQLIKSAEIGGTVPMWRWIGDGATTFSY